MISYLTLLLITTAASHVAEGSLIDICTKSRNAERQPLLAALLDLHSGEECDQPVVPSFQQLAVIEATLKQINQHNKIKLGFQVFDTCSSQQGAVTAAMQAFVASQQTCLHSPLFTGFIGPENVRFLRAVKNFTGSFNFSHILAYSILSYGSSLDKAVYVAKYPVIQFAQAIELVIERLGLKSPLIITEEGLRGHAISYYLANHSRATSAAHPESCPRRIVITVSTSQQLEENVHHVNNHDGVVVIAESDWVLWTVSRMLDSESIEDPIIIADLKNSPTQDQHVWAENVLIINQMSSTESEKNMSSMSLSVKNAVNSFATDSSRICSKHKLTCTDSLLKSVVEEEYDWTLQLYRAAILLLGSALKAVEGLKCDSALSKPCLTPDVLSQSEWHGHLEESQYLLESRNNHKMNLHFGMELPASYILKSSFGPEGLKMIGRVVDGEVRVVATEYLPVRTKNVTCPQLIQSADVPAVSTTNVDFLDGILDPENVKILEAVGVVCGVVIGVLIMMLLLTTCVYKNFNPDSSRPRSPLSHTTMSRAGSMTS